MKVSTLKLSQTNWDLEKCINVKGLLATIDECLEPETTTDSEILKHFIKCIMHQVYLETSTTGDENKSLNIPDVNAIPKEQLYLSALASLFDNEKASESGNLDGSAPEQLTAMDESGAINESGTAKPDAEMLAEICRSNIEDAQIAIAYSRGSSDAYRHMYEFLTGGNQNEY